MIEEIEALIPIFGIIFLFGIPGAIIFYAIHSKHRERVKLMDMGLTPQEAKDYFRDSERKPKNPYSSLKWGILFAFVGAALFLGFLLNEVWDVSESLTPSLVIFFGGLGFIVYYVLVKNKIKEQNGNTNQTQNPN